MSFATFGNFLLPTINLNKGAKKISWDFYPLPAIEDAVNVFSPDFQGYGLTTVLLAYLTQIWSVLCAQDSGRPADIGGITRSGLAFYPGPDNAPLSQVLLSITSPIPPATDMIFGNPPVYHFGQCGFASVDITTATVDLYGADFTIASGIGGQVFHKAEWINSINNAYFPQGDPNGFWWNLKPFVTADLTLYGGPIGFGSGCVRENPAFNQMFNPFAGAWDPQINIAARASLDGRGDPVQ